MTNHIHVADGGSVPGKGGLTQPHVAQADDEATREVEDGEERVAHEGRGLQRGQGCRHEEGHGAAAVHHQPGEQEVE